MAFKRPTRAKKYPQPKKRKPKRHLGPPMAGMRSVRSRGGKVTTVKRPSPRSA